jgi:hypothetical protein
MLKATGYMLGFVSCTVLSRLGMPPCPMKRSKLGYCSVPHQHLTVFSARQRATPLDVLCVSDETDSPVQVRSASTPGKHAVPSAHKGRWQRGARQIQRCPLRRFADYILFLTRFATSGCSNEEDSLLDCRMLLVPRDIFWLAKEYQHTHAEGNV